MDTVTRLNAALEGRYRIERELGEGGMATVYLADDLKHERKVALKVLKPELAAVVGAERFLAEIKTTANLQHPHILPLFDSGQAESFLFYVMPYIEGETLRDRLEREKQLPVDEAVRIATDVAEALHAAHQQGVIHRDIKPANILMSGGRPLVADFGIALAVSAAGGGRLTETGLSMGTPFYMSPEQASADREPSAASDVYSLGCVLYEMLVGDPPYVASSAQAVLAKILTEDAKAPAHGRASIPSNVDAAIRKSLEKLPADRFTDAQNFAKALADSGFSHGGRGHEIVARPKSSVLVAATLTVLVSIAIGWGLGRATGEEEATAGRVIRFSLPVPGGYENTVSNETPSLVVSPDSRTVVWRENGMLMRRHLDEEEAEPIPGTEGAESPFFSPDGTWLAFLQDHQFHRMSAAGTATSFSDAAIDWIHGADWGEDEAIVYGRDDLGIWRAHVGGGDPVRITDPSDHLDERAHMWPQSLSGGAWLLFTAVGLSGKWHDSKVVLENMETGQRSTVVRGAAYARYLPSGFVVYGREEGVIQAMPFDLDTGEGGESVTVETGVLLGQWGGGAAFAVSPSGTLALVRGDNSRLHLLRWYDREGSQIGQLGGAMTVAWGLELDPSGRRVATTLPSNRNDDIYILEDGMMSPRRLSSGTGSDGWPVWSPDGTRVAWQTFADGIPSVAVREIDGDDDPVVLYQGPGGVWPRSWSPDGRWLVVSERRGTGQDILAIDVDDPDSVLVVLGSPNEEWDGQLSPDGSLLAFDSSEDGFYTTRVTTFPQATEPTRVANIAAQHPRWSGSGNELFFWSDTTLMVAQYRTEPRFAVLSVDTLFSVGDYFTSVDPYYNVTPDGERFLIQVHNPDAAIREIQVVVNWLDLVRERVGR